MGRKGKIMKNAPWVKETKREFIRQKRRDLRAVKKAMGKLRYGCALITPNFTRAINRCKAALEEMDKITKPMR